MLGAQVVGPCLASMLLSCGETGMNVLHRQSGEMDRVMRCNALQSSELCY
jgi:hypothetical protein